MPTRKDIIFNKTVLDNGLRIVTEKIPSARSIAIGIWIDVGSRDEKADEKGMTHFIEHMLFKGTKTRSAQNIAGSLESLGGALNAFTSREQTCYHALILDEHLDESVDILSDILMNSTITSANIEREKLVVTEEIREINESPSDHIHELFSLDFWRNQPIGWPIMGTEETVHSYDRRRLKAYMKRNYQAGHTVVAAAGNVSHRKLVGLIKEKLDFPTGISNDRKPAIKSTGTSMKFFPNNSNQIHVCLGFPGIGYNSPDRLKLLVLNTYLGGGMSSVLFQKIREERGLAYTVFTFPDFYRDEGVFGAYLATDRKHFQSAVEIMLNEFKKIKKKKLSESKLARIKDQFKGNMLLGMESTTGRMNRLGRQELLLGKYKTSKEALKSIMKIMPADIQEVAQRILNFDDLTITALGSIGKKDLKESGWVIELSR
jgi:predicted Zn-dependent peptidase